MGRYKCGLLQKAAATWEYHSIRKTFCCRFAQISADEARKKERGLLLK
jgi:hypothetical protein